MKIYYTHRKIIKGYNIINFYNLNNFYSRFNYNINKKSIRYIHDNSPFFSNALTKVKFKEIYFSPKDFFDRLEFINKLTDSLDLSSRYALMFRVCYGDSSTYKMLGRQYGLVIPDNTQNYATLSNLHNLLVTRLVVSMDPYIYIENTISTIQIIAFKVKYTEEVTKLYNNKYNIDSFGVNFDLMDIPKNNINLVDYKILPLTMDLNKYKTNLHLVIDEDSHTIIHITLDNKKDFLNLVNLQRFGDEFVVPSESIIYLSKNKKYVTIIYVDITVDNRFMHKINVFTVYGAHIFEATDISLTPNTFSRTINNVTKVIDINNRSVVSSSIVVKLTG